MKTFTSEVTGTPIYPKGENGTTRKGGTGKEKWEAEPYTPTLGKDSPDLSFYVQKVKEAFDNPADSDNHWKAFYTEQLLNYLEPFI